MVCPLATAHAVVRLEHELRLDRVRREHLADPASPEPAGWAVRGVGRLTAVIVALAGQAWAAASRAAPPLRRRRGGVLSPLLDDGLGPAPLADDATAAVGTGTV